MEVSRIVGFCQSNLAWERLLLVLASRCLLAGPPRSQVNSKFHRGWKAAPTSEQILLAAFLQIFPAMQQAIASLF